MLTKINIVVMSSDDYDSTLRYIKQAKRALAMMNPCYYRNEVSRYLSYIEGLLLQESPIENSINKGVSNGEKLNESKPL